MKKILLAISLLSAILFWGCIHEHKTTVGYIQITNDEVLDKATSLVEGGCAP